MLIPVAVRWDCRFESRCGLVHPYLVFIVCYVGSALCDVLIARSEDSYGVYVCVFVPNFV
jgi:hypothetical protein